MEVVFVVSTTVQSNSETEQDQEASSAGQFIDAAEEDAGSRIFAVPPIFSAKFRSRSPMARWETLVNRLVALPLRLGLRR